MKLSCENLKRHQSLEFLPLPKGSGAQGRSDSNELSQSLTPRHKTHQDKVARYKEQYLEKIHYNTCRVYDCDPDVWITVGGPDHVWRDPMKYSVTGKESGASDLPFILRVQNQYLCPFGITPNDTLAKHRAALALAPMEGISGETEEATGFMKAGNYFEDGARQWFMDEFRAKLTHPTEGYRNKYCNLVASLDGLFAERWTFEGTTITKGSVWECKIPTRPSKPTDSLERVIQVQAQMDCADAEYAVIAELARMDCTWRVAIVKRHAPTIQAIHEAVDLFWSHMKYDTNYDSVTSSEASRLIAGNRQPEPHDMTDGPANGLDVEQHQDLIDAADTYINAQRAAKASKAAMESAGLNIKAIMGGMEKVKLPDGITVGHTTTEYKATPEKIVPAKPARTGRRLSVKEADNG